MNLYGVGVLVAQRRRAQGVTLQALATEAHVGRSTLAAFEAGKLRELGYGKVARICAAVGLVLEARPLALERPLGAPSTRCPGRGRQMRPAGQRLLDASFRRASVAKERRQPWRKARSPTIVERNATRDYLDVAALSHHIGTAKSVLALERMRQLYAEFAGEVGDIMISILVKLGMPDPYDLTEVDLNEYKGIIPPWNDWSAVTKQCRSLAVAMVKKAPPRAK